MARTRGSRGSRRRRRRPPTDWVVTPDGWAGAERAHNNGEINGWALVYPKDAQMIAIGDVDADEPFEFADGLQQAARGFVEPTQGITVLRVVGQVHLRADASWWTTAGLTDVTLRLQCFDYNPDTLGAVVPTGWTPNSLGYARDPFLWRYRMRQVETTNGGYFTVPIDVRVKRRLEIGQTLYLIIQNQSGAGHTVQVLPNLRTLCKVGGRARP